MNMEQSTAVLRKLLLAGLVLLAAPALAESARQVTWEDLVPQMAPYDDPFAKLNEEQFYQLGLVFHVREVKARGQPVNVMLAERAKIAERNLRENKIDIEALHAKRDEVRAERKRRAEAVVPALDQQKIRMPGFMLPLEYSGKKVSEFLLVPWVGACIHTPPPPPNQIVHVRLAKGAEFESQGLFQAVWVTGVMTAKASKTKLSLVDGSADIDVGYSLGGTAIEDYKK